MGDVALWFARNSLTGEIESILTSNKENKYTCPICKSEVIPKSTKSKSITPHFAHIDKSKCSSESIIHWWYKNKFIEIGESFTVSTNRELKFICERFEVEKVYKTDYGIYEADLVVYTECGEEIIFEIANKNKKKVQEYIYKWISIGKIVVEIDIKNLINDDKNFKALYYNGKCFNFNTRDGGYYKSIGILKEKLNKENVTDIERIKVLDWFWNELSNWYLKDEKDKLFEVIDCMNKDDLYFIYDNLLNTKYKKFLIEYLNTLVDEYDKKLKYDFPHNYRVGNKNRIDVKVIANAKKPYVSISIFSHKPFNYKFYDIFKSNYNEIKEDIIRILN